MALRQEVRRVTRDGAEWWQHTMNRMVRCRTVPELLDLAYDAIRGGLGYDRVGVFLVDPSRHVLVTRIITDEHGRKLYPDDDVITLDSRRYSRLLSDARMQADGPGFAYGDNALIDGLSPAGVDRSDDQMPRTLFVALRTPGSVIGLLTVCNGLDNYPVTLEDAPLLVALAAALAAALENAVIVAAHSDHGQRPDTDLHRRVAELERLLEHERLEHERLRVAYQNTNAARPEHDAVTGLLNHRALLERLDRNIAAATPFTLLLLDIDNFKLFNDTHSHMTGDRLLSDVAAVLRRVCREEDIAGRYGADEFAVILHDTTIQKTRVIARRIESLVRAQPHVTPDGAIIPLSVSTGLAGYPIDGPARRDVVAVAERHLALSKHGSRLPRRPHHANDLLGESQIGVLNGLVTAVDSKDRYTREHSEDVTRWALLLANVIGLDTEQRRVLALAGPLHDVGKIAVPDRILRKPGRLTREEHEIMRHHVLFGVAIIQGVLHDAAVLDAVSHHHERWDGCGYPHGLIGAQASLPGRIMQIADAVSAMRLDRPYRQGLPWTRVIAEVRAGSGSQFDPDLIEPFIAAARV